MAQRTHGSSYDCVVIGSGPGGYVAAVRAAQLGLRTAIVEKDAIGGRCLNYACIPAKAVLRSADVLADVRGAAQFGVVVGQPTVDFAAVVARRQKVVKTLTGGVAGLMKKNAIDVIDGHGSVTDDGNVRIGGNFDGSEIQAGVVILATGSVKRPIPGTRFAGRVIGTEEAWGLTELPRRMAVVGAGASGSEIASAYARLGTDVLLFEMLDRVLPTEDAEISKLAGRGLAKQGMKIHTGTPVENVDGAADSVRFSHGGETAEVDYLVIAAGRAPDVDGLGLAEAGIALDARGMIKVDSAMRTSLAGVFAIGDLVPGPALAHKASDEGIIAAEAAAGLETHPLVHVDIPRATFCTPNVASFGLTEAQAVDAGHDVVVGRIQYGAVGAGTVYGDRTGLVKIVGDRRYGELLGGHIVGAKAPELIQELVNVRALEGGFAEVARIVHGHPTLSEAVMEAARDADGWLIHG
ncbi:MAG TPA: dihydrolipoyl dehydrogenase [Solirubrobacteraceae bacterium]|nr:dihydrolipoyl dehydrogenase [Solirubrobacteraceae bacterium]